MHSRWKTVCFKLGSSVPNWAWNNHFRERNETVVFVRASDDLTSSMVAADTMEDFHKELDKGKVRRTTWGKGHCLPFLG